MFKKIFVFGILALFLAACSTTNNQFYETEPGVELVVINQGTRTVMVGSTFQFTATVTAVGGAATGVNWLIGDDTVATVNQTGTVTGVGVGTTTVTAVSQHDPEQTATVNLTVIRAPAVDSVTLTQDNFALRIGQINTLSVTVVAVSGANTGVTWSSSNEDVVTVSTTGVVTAISGGVATITVRSVFNSAVFDTVTVSVQQVVALTTSPSDIALVLDEEDTAQVTTTVTVLGNAPQTVVYASTNPAVATVSSTGLVTAVSEGTAYVVVTSAFDGSFFSVIPVEVTEPEDDDDDDDV
jgi:trimeric autotransporter adhesin